MLLAAFRLSLTLKFIWFSASLCVFCSPFFVALHLMINGSFPSLFRSFTSSSVSSSIHLVSVHELISNFSLHRRQQQAVIEKFAICEENLSQLLRWITEVEYKISSVGGPKERIDELRNQINLLKVRSSEIISRELLIEKLFTNSKLKKTSTYSNARSLRASNKSVKLSSQAVTFCPDQKSTRLRIQAVNYGHVSTVPKTAPEDS